MEDCRIESEVVFAGYWTIKEKEAECSFCGYEVKREDLNLYCPNCGCKMSDDDFNTLVVRVKLDSLINDEPAIDEVLT